MADAKARFDMATTAAEQHAIRGQARAVAFQARVELVPGQAATKLEVHPFVHRVARQYCVGAAHERGAGGFILQAGVDEHMTKPVDPDALMERLTAGRRSPAR